MGRTKDKIKATSKSELAHQYGIHYNTLRVWLKRLPDLELAASQRILTPKQLEKISTHLGSPLFNFYF